MLQQDSQKVAEFIRSIPGPEDQPLKILSDNPDYTSAKLILQLFDAVDVSETKTGLALRAKTDTALRFLLSLSRYIEKGFPIVSNWDFKVPEDEFSEEDLLIWGTQLMRKLEEKRVYKLGDKEVLETVELVLIIIKAQVEGSNEPQILFQFNDKTMMYQVIGGYRHHQDEAEAIKGQLSWELPNNKWIEGETYTYKKAAGPIVNYGVSRQRGIYTQYNTTYFWIECKLDKLKLGNQDIWVTLEEVSKGFTEEGMSLMALRQPGPGSNLAIDVLNTIEGLGLSFAQQQPAKKRVGKKLKSDPNIDRVAELLKQGESDKIEFKSTLRWDLRQQQVNKDLEKVIIKTLVAFMNSDGGTLLVGVEDDGNVIGIEGDIATVNRKNEDGLVKHVYDLMNTYLGAENVLYVHVRVVAKEGKRILMFEISRALGPVFVKEGESREFYVRLGNTSKKLNSEDAYKYINASW